MIQRDGLWLTNTLAIFMQPNVNEVIGKANGTTFGEFAEILVEML